ncbi:hypothetical protein DZA50_00625 [Kangiella sp. HD9-110m-PIT-SAG07]|nr:hypothetical protein DZA50_00625 [Kangiella sp. HD9-110m-PIT-SAG07]
MRKALTSIIVLFFSISAFACSETSKPKLILEKISESNSGCTSYYVVIPKTFNGTEIKDVVFSSKNPVMHFYLEFSPHEKLNRTYSPICVTQPALDHSEMTLYYKEPTGNDGGMKLCMDEYRYSELSQYIE